ncbi:Hypothetical predicted protein [Olea europaea subsp. europaea]|uniref:Uncharacterized protein n=1 Tax=Olea europaea subsp. europaea TaxID=158383 RepID=A0A8S0RYR7_OLEEU|nr:Hypothetical predicted protein [Olea europaea subsp. europaea]
MTTTATTTTITNTTTKNLHDGSRSKSHTHHYHNNDDDNKHHLQKPPRRQKIKKLNPSLQLRQPTTWAAVAMHAVGAVVAASSPKSEEKGDRSCPIPSDNHRRI